MPMTQLAFPSSSSTDSEDVIVALNAGSALWSKGERAEALRLLRRARDAADEAGDDLRALELARSAADLTSALASVAPTPAVSDAAPSELRRSKLPEPPAPARKFSGAADGNSAPSNAVQERPSLRPAAPSQRPSAVPQPSAATEQRARSTASTSARLTSVSVTLQRHPDGSLKAVPVDGQAKVAPENQAVLVLSEALWSKLTTR